MTTFAQNLALITEQNMVLRVPFSVGNYKNEDPSKAMGSLALLAHGSNIGLTVSETIWLFAEHFDAVHANPNGTDHPNIRALLACDHAAYIRDVVSFDGEFPLLPRAPIEAMWEERTKITPESDPSYVERLLSELDAGRLRVASKSGGEWVTDQTLKKAVLLSFRLRDNVVMPAGPMQFYDKVPTKFASYSQADFVKGGFRVVPPAVARRGCFIGKNVVMMPSFVNIGAYVDEGTMVDAWATVGSCAQIGKNVHLSGGVGIGGVLEPMQAGPTIIEDNCFIGARSEIVEGVVVEENSVISMGVYIGQSTKIYDRTTGEVSYGRIPAGSVVVSGNLPSDDGKYSLYCAVIVKRVDAQTRAKVGINELLREA